MSHVTVDAGFVVSYQLWTLSGRAGCDLFGNSWVRIQWEPGFFSSTSWLLKFDLKRGTAFKHRAAVPIRHFSDLSGKNLKGNLKQFNWGTGTQGCQGRIKFLGTTKNRASFWALVVAQLVERLLPTPEIRGSNPDIIKIVYTNCTIEKTKIKKKRPGMGHLKKKKKKKQIFLIN